ncbi:methanogenesis marker 2 protein [Methanonatronarchaeum sp. AMET6-2]|uniref:methanogenesis marker 2 protein n=1 Tax=Methanonatronarchaeum sp. AMET6-2 TaxID=2933293 RepID=UPI00121E0E37|nr:methanogenesis marker 2 protein [Methanonatronarchaeum sp. AMET6-2]RZN60405.1 MAG: methanogenesis marker 2 protein [Methanonatronarchaeia archaeon]UOY10387.1 methanogenesis marker 2 protein [Methanonatronarchaeum sp. AMET6-2]
MLELLASEIRSFPGVTRKNPIGPLVEKFANDPDNVIASFGEDAAVIQVGEEGVVLAADGIWDKLMRADPFWAGYCSVLVNTHDIAAMGGNPLAMVSVCSTSDPGICSRLVEGINEGIDKLAVPMVGGHTNPDCEYNAIDVAIMGTIDLEHVIYSTTAEPGDDIVVGIDLDGRVHPSFQYNYDTTTMKEPRLLQKQLGSMEKLAHKNLVTAGKDISNPGMIGTAGMMIETCDLGAEIEIDSLPKPDDINLVDWIKMYPGMGFVVTTPPEKTNQAVEVFEESGLTGRKIGSVKDHRELIIHKDGEEETVFNFKKDKITGISCRKPKDK